MSFLVINTSFLLLPSCCWVVVNTCSCGCTPFLLLLLPPCLVLDAEFEFEEEGEKAAERGGDSARDEEEGEEGEAAAAADLEARVVAAAVVVGEVLP